MTKLIANITMLYMQFIFFYTIHFFNTIIIFAHIIFFNFNDVFLQYNTFVFNTLNNPPIRNQLLLILQRLFSILFVIQKVLISILSNTI